MNKWANRVVLFVLLTCALMIFQRVTGQEIREGFLVESVCDLPLPNSGETSINRHSCRYYADASDGYVFSGDRYAYERFGGYYREDKRHRGFNGEAYLRRYYDQANPFSSGISSYQGTSTGPGPNGGYPGTPRGVYKTLYAR